MNYVFSFLVCGCLCAIGQIIVEETKLNYGEVNTIFVAIGAFMSFLGIYDKIIMLSGCGASIPITNFGHLVYKGAYEGYINGGFSGLLKGAFSLAGPGIVFTIFISFVISVLFRPRD